MSAPGRTQARTLKRAAWSAQGRPASRHAALQTPRKRCTGLGAVAVIMVLVLLSALAAAVVRLSQAAQTGVALDLGAARASAAARAGIDWGLYQAFKGGWTACAGASQTLDLSASTGMRVTVTCNSSAYNDGETAPGTPRVLRVYTLDAVACNAGSSCPDATAAARPGYVERRRQAQASDS
jgi:MSHA biogenesis protein MshP